MNVWTLVPFSAKTMKSSSVVCFLLVVTLVAGGRTANNRTALRFLSAMDSFEHKWQDFKAKYNKRYSLAEEATRKIIFRKNLQSIETHNLFHDKHVKSFRLGVNEYSDMGTEEFFEVMNCIIPRNRSGDPAKSTGSDILADINLPKSLDWRTKGYVTAVKNQSRCGACWAFSATGSLEGQHFNKTGNLVSLSEQNLIDCSTGWGNKGCKAGAVAYAFKYIRDNKGVDTEGAYPYQGKRRRCRFKQDEIGATLTSYKYTKPGDEKVLKAATAKIGPISIVIDARHESFKCYKSGVYIEPQCSSEHLNHAALIVGYGTDNGTDYWLVKNSWGTSWGLDGYIKMARNKNNQCGVATQALFPVV